MAHLNDLKHFYCTTIVLFLILKMVAPGNEGYMCKNVIYACILDGGEDFPTFLTLSQDIKARQGENINLHCQTLTPGESLTPIRL